jgi:hypothetical protein
MLKNSVYYAKVDPNKIWGRELCYTMRNGDFHEICGDNFDPQKIIDYINETYGLMGVVTELHLEG